MRWVSDGYGNRERGRGRGRGRTLELGEGLGGGELVALDDFAWVEAHDEELLGLLEHLAGEDHDAVCCVSHLREILC